MDVGKRTAMGSSGYLEGVQEWTREELSQMGVELDKLDDDKYGSRLPESESKPVTRWVLLGLLGISVAILATFGSLYHHEGTSAVNDLVPVEVQGAFFS